MNNVIIKACSVCWGSGRTIDGKPCLCGCMPNIVTSKPEDYGLPTYQQLQQQIATLTRQRNLAVEALETYGRHHPDCHCNTPVNPCDCGLSEAFSDIKESEAMEGRGCES